MATFALTYNIHIGLNRLKGLSKVEIRSSVDTLSDTATITLPAYINNVTYDIERRVKRGMKVKFDLGYDGENVTEFVGYVRSISVNSPVVIECEDEMFLFRKAVKSEVFVNASVTEILESVASQLSFGLDSSVSDLKYDKFVIQSATGYEVLMKIKDQFNISLYIRDGKLFAGYRYLERFGNVTVDFEQNVKASNLQYVSAEDVKVQVQLKGVGKDNKSTRQIEVGERGGEVIKLPPRLNITDEAALERIAKDELKRLSYSGFRGDVTTFGRPYSERGYVAKVIDPDYPDRVGNYFVKGVTVSFSQNGYERKLELGERLS